MRLKRRLAGLTSTCFLDGVKGEGARVKGGGGRGEWDKETSGEEIEGIVAETDREVGEGYFLALLMELDAVDGGSDEGGGTSIAVFLGMLVVEEEGLVEWFDFLVSMDFLATVGGGGEEETSLELLLESFFTQTTFGGSAK